MNKNTIIAITVGTVVATAISAIYSKFILSRVCDIMIEHSEKDLNKFNEGLNKLDEDEA